MKMNIIIVVSSLILLNNIWISVFIYVHQRLHLSSLLPFSPFALCESAKIHTVTYLNKINLQIGGKALERYTDWRVEQGSGS